MEILGSLALVAASFGMLAVLGTLVWCWMKFSLFYRKNYQNF